MLATLISHYPHQCLWQSVAVYRSKSAENAERHRRCEEVYQTATELNNDVANLAAHYVYLASLLMDIANDASVKVKPRSKEPTVLSMAEKFKHVKAYIEKGYIDIPKFSRFRYFLCTIRVQSNSNIITLSALYIQYVVSLWEPQVRFWLAILTEP